MRLDLGDLQIRSWRKGDLDALVRHANNAKIACNLRDQFPHPYTRRDGKDYLDFVLRVEQETSFALEYEGEAVGGVGFLLGVDIARMSAEMGYWLSEMYWGRGLATRAAMAASDWAFDHYRLTRVFAQVFSHNLASMRVLEKAGFHCEGVLCRSAVKNGVILDQMLYAKVR